MTASSARVALCVREWGSEETLYAWTWTKNHFLEQTNRDSLELLVFHVCSKKGSHAWTTGGPCMPDLRTELADYNPKLIEIETVSSPGFALAEAVEQHNIDVVVLGMREKGTIKHRITRNTSDHVVSSVNAMCLVIRPKPAIGDCMRLSRRITDPETLNNATLPLTRRIALVPEVPELAPQLFSWARDKYLRPGDQVWVASMTGTGARLRERIAPHSRTLEGARVLTPFELAVESELNGVPLKGVHPGMREGQLAELATAEGAHASPHARGGLRILRLPDTRSLIRRCLA